GDDCSLLERAEQQLVVSADEPFQPGLVVQVARLQLEDEGPEAVGDTGEGDERPTSELLADAAQQIVGEEPAQGLCHIGPRVGFGLSNEVADVELALGEDPREVVEGTHLPFPSIARSSRSRRSRSSRFSCSSSRARARELSAGSYSHQSMPIDLA